MTQRIGHRLFLVGLLAIAVLAAAALVYATPQGLGLSDDSIAYVAGARSMLQGAGYREIWLASSQPVTHLPPGYPAALALIGRVLQLDPLRAARLLNVGLWGGSTILIGLLGWKMTGFRAAGLVLAAFFGASSSLLRLHADALSEPLFIFLTLLVLFALARLFPVAAENRPNGKTPERPLSWWAVAGGALAGLAYLTRYAGLALIAALVATLPFLERGWRRTGTLAAALLAGFVPLAASWSIRNQLAGGTATNRTLGWHPITAENLEMGRYNVAAFLVPVETARRALVRSPLLVDSIAVVLLVGLLAWLVFHLVRRLRRAPAPPPEPFSLANALYALVYFASLLVTMTFFDASTKFALRILSPLFVAVLVLLVGAGVWIWRRASTLARILVGIAAVVWLGASLYGTADALAVLHRGGQGYASFKWYDSEAMAYLRGLPPEMRIYTNEPGAVYLYTHRGAYVLPSLFDPATGVGRSGYEEGVARLQADVRSGRGVLALFDDRDVLPEERKALTQGLTVVHKSAGDTIFGVAP